VQFGPVRLHDAATGAIAQVWEEVDNPSDLAWSPDGRWLAVGSYEHAAQVFDAATGRVRDSYANFEPRGDGKSYGVTALAWAPDGARLALGSYDGTAHVWRLQLTP
jgi:WD40 repeat protein